MCHSDLFPLIRFCAIPAVCLVLGCPQTPGPGCTSDLDCLAGQVCEGGECVADEPPGHCAPELCDDNDPCTTEQCMDIDGDGSDECVNTPVECQEGLFCSPDTGECVAELPPAPGEHDYVLYVNPDDPRILEITTEDGEVLELHGQKDADGIATKLDFIKYQDVDQVGTDAATWLVYNDNSELDRIIGEDGSTISFDWQSDTEAVITAVSADGAIEASLDFDFANPDGNGSAAKAVIADVPSGTGIARDMRIYPQPSVASPSLPRMRAAVDSAPKTSGSPVYVTVTRCGEPVDGAWVFVAAGRPGAALWATFPASRTGAAGEYKAMLPTAQSGLSAQAEAICKGMVPQLGHGCTALSVLPKGMEPLVCSAIAAAIEAGMPTVGEIVPIFKACMGGFVAARLYCATFGGGPITGGPSAADKICDNIKDKVDSAFPPGDVGVRATAYEGGEQASSSDVTVPGAGPFPTLSISFDCDDCDDGDCWGDPHLVTFDRLAYDFQAVGEFVMVRSISVTPWRYRLG